MSKDKQMNFRLKNGAWRTYAGPEYLNCYGSVRPVIHCFTTRPFVLKKGHGKKDIRVWLVGNSIPQLIDSETRMAFIKKIYAEKNRMIRSFNYHSEKLKVFYTRNSAVKAFEKLVAVRNNENLEAKRELNTAIEKGDIVTASQYL